LGRGCSVKRVDVYLPPQMVRQDPDIGSVGRGLGGSQVSGFATEQSSGVLHDHGHQPGLSIPAAPYWHLWRSWRGLSPQIGKFSNGVVHFQIVSPFPSAVARRLRRSHVSRGTTRRAMARRSSSGYAAIGEARGSAVLLSVIINPF
jgi:hypothetical protein